MRHLLALLLLTPGYFTHQLIATDYLIGPDYAVKFATGGAEGTFSDLRGTVSFDPADPENSRFDVSVATATISTGNSAKDKHARGDKWLNAEEHPRIGFVSDTFTKTATGFEVTGQLSINGRARTQVLSFQFDGQVFEGSTTVNREEYGIDGPFLFGGLVGGEIAVTLRVPVRTGG